MSHAPANNYFGFQYGNGANNYNGADNGFGGWFSYNGTFVNANSTSIQTVNGAGDFAFEMDCCPDYEIVRCWTAMDCSGNTVEHCQTISFAPIADGNDGNVAEQPSYEAEADKGGHVTVYPNPAVDQTNFVFKAVESGKAMIEIYDLAGDKVASVYTASVEAGNEYKTTFNAGSLATGVYMYKLVNGNSVEMGRLIIKK
ncbi:MAG: T9SS type A sorting domain-containing protein [Flavobacteriales bacterium]